MLTHCKKWLKTDRRHIWLFLIEKECTQLLSSWEGTQAPFKRTQMHHCLVLNLWWLLHKNDTQKYFISYLGKENKRLLDKSYEGRIEALCSVGAEQVEGSPHFHLTLNAWLRLRWLTVWGTNSLTLVMASAWLIDTITPSRPHSFLPSLSHFPGYLFFLLLFVPLHHPLPSFHIKH